MNESKKEEKPEKEGAVRSALRYLLERNLVEWDVGQRRHALHKARNQCYIGVFIVMCQWIGHNVYKLHRGIEPPKVDDHEKMWLTCAYHITLVWALVVYLSMWHYISSVGNPTPKDRKWTFMRLDRRSKHLVLYLTPIWFLVVIGQALVSITYPLVYKNQLHSNFINNFEEYYTSITVRKFIDDVQESFKCCGFHGYRDWVKLRRISGNNSFPFTCCRTGSTCDFNYVLNHLASYKTWYDSSDYSISRTKIPYKEKIKNVWFTNIIHGEDEEVEEFDFEEIPIRQEGCAGKILQIHPFYFPCFLDVIQIIVTLNTMIYIRRYSTGTAFAARAIRQCPKNFIMLSAAHACPRWTFLTPTKRTLWKWQTDYLTRIYFHLLYAGKIKLSKYHQALYPHHPIMIPDFKKTFDLREREYKSFLRYEVGKQRAKPNIRDATDPLLMFF